MSQLKCKIFCRLQMEIPTVQLHHKLTLSTTTKLNIKNFEFTQLTEISTKTPRISLREPLAIHVVQNLNCFSANSNISLYICCMTRYKFCNYQYLQIIIELNNGNTLAVQIVSTVKVMSCNQKTDCVMYTCMPLLDTNT